MAGTAFALNNRGNKSGGLMNKSIFAITILGFFTLISFQNCSGVKFSPADGNLQAKSDPQDTGDQVTDPLPPVTDPIMQPPAVDPTPTPAPGDDGKKHCDHGKGGQGMGDDQDGNAQGANYICILEGPGESVRLGVLSDVLQDNGHTPDTVCMTKEACLNIVSQKFQVKDAVVRGFCPGKNPHVVPLTDAQIKEKIDKL
jgi:hypothetical protein